MKASDLVQVPMVPNFLILKGTKIPVSVAGFTDKELRSIGKEWTEKLIENAAKKREQEK